MRAIFLLCSVIILSSCQADKEREELDVYYALRPLLISQINTLSGSSPTVVKKVVLDDKPEQTEMVPDSAGWANELEIFFENDINKPALVGSYEESISEGKITYLLKDQDRDGVQKFEVYFFEGTQIPKTIRIESSVDNSLYTSFRLLELNFANVNNSAQLNAYTIRGEQTILSGDATNYQLEAELKF